VLIPVFGVVSFLLPKIYNPRAQDFAAYWQAGYMLRTGQDVYDSRSWLRVRELFGTARHTESTFIYPLPFVVLFSPISGLPIDIAYIFWTFLIQIAILISISILLNFYPGYSADLILIVVAGIFLFRATYITIFSGQILALLLLATTLAIYLLQHHQQFFGGVLLAFLTFKPSLGLPVLLLLGIWLLFSKRWLSILGMIIGGLESVS
jgi:hypothetical protein